MHRLLSEAHPSCPSSPYESRHPRIFSSGMDWQCKRETLRLEASWAPDNGSGQCTPWGWSWVLQVPSDRSRKLPSPAAYEPLWMDLPELYRLNQLPQRCFWRWICRFQLRSWNSSFVNWDTIGSSTSRFNQISPWNGSSDLSQLAESNAEWWRLADTFVYGRGVPIGNSVSQSPSS